MVWIWAVALFLLLATKGAFLPFAPALRIGTAVEMDWRDILALLIVGLAIFGVATKKVTVKETLIIVGAARVQDEVLGPRGWRHVPRGLLYAVFMVVIAVLYWSCRWYARRKATNPALWMRYI